MLRQHYLMQCAIVKDADPDRFPMIVFQIVEGCGLRSYPLGVDRLDLIADHDAGAIRRAITLQARDDDPFIAGC